MQRDGRRKMKRKRETVFSDLYRFHLTMPTGCYIFIAHTAACSSLKKKLSTKCSQVTQVLGEMERMKMLQYYVYISCVYLTVTIISVFSFLLFSMDGQMTKENKSKWMHYFKKHKTKGKPKCTPLAQSVERIISEKLH